MSNVTTIIKLGAAVLITIAAIAIAIALFGQGAEITKNSEDDIQGISEVIDNAKYDAYNGTEVSGSSVINAIRMYAETGELTVSVDTLMSPAATTYNEATPYAVTDSTLPNYINPVGDFNSTMVANTNGVVTGITFVQN